MENKRFEVHSHTHYSNFRLLDCINRPKDLINRAINLGLAGISITDHETLAAHPEVKFVSVDSENTNGFYATRCYVRLSSGNSKMISARHLGEATSINAIASQDELVDVYSVSGAKVASQLRASEVNSLRPAIYVIKGQKILVK